MKPQQSAPIAPGLSLLNQGVLASSLWVQILVNYHSITWELDLFPQILHWNHSYCTVSIDSATGYSSFLVSGSAVWTGIMSTIKCLFHILHVMSRCFSQIAVRQNMALSYFIWQIWRWSFFVPYVLNARHSVLAFLLTELGVSNPEKSCFVFKVTE